VVDIALQQNRETLKPFFPRFFPEIIKKLKKLRSDFIA